LALQLNKPNLSSLPNEMFTQLNLESIQPP
jgi:hypothetical protein